MFYQILTNISIQNKYTKWYIQICKNSQLRASSRKEAKSILGFTEAHHILPKSFGLCGTKDSSNLAYLTTKEHFIVHHLATKMFDNNFKFKMIEALAQFKQGRAEKLNANQIAIIMQNKATPCSENRRANISKSRLLTQKITCTHCNKSIEPGNFAKYHGDNCKSNPNLNPEVFARYKALAKLGMKTQKANGNYKKPQTPKGEFSCPHCDKVGTNYGSMQRHHFNNCPKLTGHKVLKKAAPRCSCIRCHKETDNCNISRHVCKH